MQTRTGIRWGIRMGTRVDIHIRLAGGGGYWLCMSLSIAIVSRQAIVNLRCQVGTQPNQRRQAQHNARQLIKSWHGHSSAAAVAEAARNRCQLIRLIV